MAALKKGVLGSRKRGIESMLVNVGDAARDAACCCGLERIPWRAADRTEIDDFEDIAFCT